MTNRTFVQWQAYIGPLWQPKSQLTAWNWAIAGDLALTGAGTLTASLASGATSVAYTGLALPAKGGAWIGPNGSGQGWEYVGYTSPLSGLVRESTTTREHNGVHTSGAAVRLWAPVSTDDGKLHIVWETNQNLNAATWTAQLGGIAAPRAFIKRHHAIFIQVRYTAAGAWIPYLLGWIQEYSIDDDYTRSARWKLKVVSIAGMLEQVPLKPLSSGDLDIVKYGKIIKQDVTLASPYKERQSGDYTQAEPDFRAQSAIDDNDETPWIAERFTGTPGDLSEASFADEPRPPGAADELGNIFVSHANLTVPTGQGKGYRWIQLQPTQGPNIGQETGYICNKNGPITSPTQLLDLAGSASHLSRLIICENLTLFSANNPICEPTRIVEIGSPAFDLIDLASDCLAYYENGWYNSHAIKWGNNVNVRPKDPQGSYGTAMTGPCIAAPANNQVIRYHYAGNNVDPYQHFIVDYADMAGYEPSGTNLDPWFLVQLPGMGLQLTADLTAGYTGLLELWDGKTTQTNGLPSSGTLQIGSEQITFNSKTTSSIILTARGANGTAAAAHSAADPVYIVDNGQATDAFQLKSLSWMTRTGGIHPVNFKLYGGKMAAQPRYPVADDEDPNHEYPLDYELLADVTNHATSTYTLTLTPSKRITWLLVSVSRMSADPARVRLHSVTGLMDTSLMDSSLWLDSTAETFHCFGRLLANAGIPDEAILIYSDLGSPDPLKLTTAKGFAWNIIVDLADYTSVYIEVSLLSHLTLRTNNLWRTDEAQTVTNAWTRATTTGIQFLAERPNPIAQLQMKWILPNGDEGGTIIYPATLDPTGEIQTLNDAMYPDATKANNALQRRYLVAKYPFSLGIECAYGNDALKPGEFNTLTWDFADGTAVRTGFVRDVEHTIEKMTWRSAIRLMQLREAL